MFSHRFKNYNFTYKGNDFLGNGIGYYVVEDYDEDGKEASFEKVELYDAIGREGFILDKARLDELSDGVIFALNHDSHLCRTLGNKII